jgi:Early Flowering 4 domain
VQHRVLPARAYTKQPATSQPRQHVSQRQLGQLRGVSASAEHSGEKQVRGFWGERSPRAVVLSFRVSHVWPVLFRLLINEINANHGTNRYVDLRTPAQGATDSSRSSAESLQHNTVLIRELNANIGRIIELYRTLSAQTGEQAG